MSKTYYNETASLTRDQAKVHAKERVRELLSCGYSADSAYHETSMGSSAKGGYEIRKGKIEAPMFSGHVFSFLQLADEIKAEERQPEFSL